MSDFERLIETIVGPGRAVDPKFKAVAHALELLKNRLAMIECRVERLPRVRGV